MKSLKGKVGTMQVIVACACMIVFFLSEIKAEEIRNLPKEDNIILNNQNGSEKQFSMDKLVEQEEKYIVDLVSRCIGKEVGEQEWEKCLKYLTDNYRYLENNKSIDLVKVKSYINAYTLLREDIKFPDEYVNENETFFASKGGYSPSKVTAYTNKYWNKHNPNYPNFDKPGFGGDCANFVSQALYAGGKKMKGSDSSNFAHWFCKTKTENLSKVSSTWRGADAFGHYWMSHSVKYKKFGKKYFVNKEEFKKVFKYGSVGDAISMLNANGRPYHTLIISYKEDSKLKFASHTANHKWKSLYNYFKNSSAAGVRIYKMK